ncbi:uncharacterized protein TRIADDRAFT_25365 [Trichoplax adhaerens]|uniref:Methionine adenosyltransferase 2 subunit beta n=1 Tax=Trichoplax adhaerens TaxID=10228 RepID=B3RYK6_TRIAD|nr:hypothetical protein TRIADDRAFT_25365 [Trichoplax adhaerens]EDV25057.1 hypothetical protein TRIADDRAFT_25365 [Trichoplax adhaerens]|eukprot:XP_002112947.1 hypothetical protein TRIADDRAFT_25365 [Trichoplax adhaerens]
MRDDQRKKVLITGASGLLGRAILKEFEVDGSWECVGLAFTRAKGNLRKVDLKDVGAVRALVSEFRPTVIIHSAAERRPDVVEQQLEASRQLNVVVSQNLASIAKEFNCFLLYISTNGVFDGKSPPYKPSDVPNPSNSYCIFKFEGEKATLQTLPKSSGVLRVPYLYGQVENLAECSCTALFQAVLNNTKSKSVTDYGMRYPTLVDDIAIVIRQICEKALSENDFRGIWHWSGSEALTKYQMTKIMAEVFNLDFSHIKPASEPPTGAKRSNNSQLDCSDLMKLNFGRHTPFRVGIQECLRNFVNVS